MGKILLIVLVALFVYWFLRSFGRSAEKEQHPPGSRTLEDMVRCAYCGLHIPKSESVSSGKAFYCTEEHRLLHSK